MSRDAGIHLVRSEALPATRRSRRGRMRRFVVSPRSSPKGRPPFTGTSEEATVPASAPKGVSGSRDPRKDHAGRVHPEGRKRRGIDGPRRRQGTTRRTQFGMRRANPPRPPRGRRRRPKPRVQQAEGLRFRRSEEPRARSPSLAACVVSSARRKAAPKSCRTLRHPRQRPRRPEPRKAQYAGVLHGRTPPPRSSGPRPRRSAARANVGWPSHGRSTPKGRTAGARAEWRPSDARVTESAPCGRRSPKGPLPTLRPNGSRRGANPAASPKRRDARPEGPVSSARPGGPVSRRLPRRADVAPPNPVGACRDACPEGRLSLRRTRWAGRRQVVLEATRYAEDQSFVDAPRGLSPRRSGLQPTPLVRGLPSRYLSATVAEADEAERCDEAGHRVVPANATPSPKGRRRVCGQMPARARRRPPSSRPKPSPETRDALLSFLSPSALSNQREPLTADLPRPPTCVPRFSQPLDALLPLWPPGSVSPR
jgi:hypothetical protein